MRCIVYHPMLAYLIIFVFILIVIDRQNQGFATSKLDGHNYVVRNDFENKQQAAEILAEINAMFVRLISELKNKHGNDPTWGYNIDLLSERFNHEILGEHIPRGTKLTSFVRNKTEKIRMCLRKPDNRNVFHDMTTLKFVAIHELAHVGTVTQGHKEDFWDFFEFMLKVAKGMGELEMIDYARKPVNYCGLVIDSNPYHNH